ncbi:MAG TPA: cell division protein ZapA [Longimicrobiales bacterium]|nr:cell division protein ZapA [Longimicrobiales bacterium]
MNERNVVTVEIAGEAYAIRSPTDPDRTRACAAKLDRSIREVLAQSSLVQPHKAAILAGLTIANELFEAREELARLERETGMRALRLSADVERRLGADDLATGS